MHYIDTLEEHNEVCSVCFEKLRREYVDRRKFWESFENISQQKSKNPRSPEEIEKSINSLIKTDIEEWNKLTKDGLSAMQVFIDILDGHDADVVWHRRRINFMKDLIEKLDIKYFAPASRQEVAYFAQSAVDFWNDKISHLEMKKQYNYMKNVLQIHYSETTNWDSKNFLLWMTEDQKCFDWMWDQWFECIRVCIPDKCNDKHWIELFHKHFSEEIMAWAYED